MSSSDICESHSRISRADFRFRNEKVGSIFRTFSDLRVLAGVTWFHLLMKPSYACRCHSIRLHHRRPFRTLFDALFQAKSILFRNRSATEVKFRLLLYSLLHSAVALLSRNSRLHSPRRRKVHPKTTTKTKTSFARSQDFPFCRRLFLRKTTPVDFINAYLEDSLLGVAKIFQPLASP